jgi:predicted small secreted protein
MKRMMSVVLMGLVGLAGFSSMGCNTVKGIGDDISGAAQGVQDAAKKNDEAKEKPKP